MPENADAGKPPEHATLSRLSLRARRCYNGRMCGRMVRVSPAEVLREEFGVDPPADLKPRYNVCPGDDVLAVVPRHEALRMGWLRWGLVPYFAKDPREGLRAINARAETVATRPAFRRAFATRRCLVVADGFYEWRRDGTRRTPFFVRLRSARPLAFAGLWERWRPEEEGAPPIVSCTIVTCPANALLAPIHDRMPVVLDAGDRRRWLDATTPSPGDVLRPCPPSLLEAWEVSPRVNSGRFDDAGLLDPVA